MGRRSYWYNPKRKRPVTVEGSRKHIRQQRLRVYAKSSADDRDILAEKLHISKEQMKYVTNTGPGEGLIRYDKVLLPFTDHFPTNTKIYSLINTKPNG